MDVEAKSWFQENLGKHIRKQRSERDLTKGCLSDRTKIDDKHIGKLERGRKLPNSYTLAKIIVSLDLNLENLLADFEALFFEDKTFKR